MIQKSEMSYDEVREYLRAMSEKIGENLRYSCIFGSGAHGPPITNDVDVFFLTTEEIDESLREELVDDYMRLHEQADLSPDVGYPGEYVTKSEFQDALAGKGFHYDDGVVIQDLERGESMWNEFNSHRHHLSAIGGATELVYGSPVELFEDKMAALRTLVTVLLLEKDRSTVEVSEIVSWLTDGGKYHMGFKPTESERAYLSEKLRLALLGAADDGMFEYSDGEYEIVDRTPFNELEANVEAFNER